MPNGPRYVRRQRLCSASLVLTAVLVLGQLGGFIHHAAVAHTTCREHGELIHAGESEVRPLAARPAEQERSVRSEPASSASGDTHEHCTIACLRRESLALVADGGIDPPQESSATPASGSLTGSLRSIELLLLAPKGSPPSFS